MKVTIFGFAGTGKSSVAGAIAKDLGWEFKSNGNLFRELAEERGVSLNKFERLAEQDDSIDKNVDERTENFGKINDNFVFEARLAWFFIPDSVKIKLACDDDERLRRISNRDGISIDEARMETIDREESIKLRYKNIYGIDDFSNDDHFDFVLDTTEIDLPTVIGKVKDYIINHPDYES